MDSLIMSKVTKCNRCGKGFERAAGEINRNKNRGFKNYCSRICSGKEGKPQLVNCNFCNRKFKRSLKHINQNKKRGSKNYCSRHCGCKSLKHTEEAKRKISKTHKGKKFSKDHTEKIVLSRKNNGRPWHSKKAKEKIKRSLINKRLGNKNPNWRSGTTLIGKLRRKSNAYQKMRKAVLERDIICVLCGSDNRLEVDHYLKRFSDCSYKEAIDPNNCRVLCYECHTQTPTYGANKKLQLSF